MSVLSSLSKTKASNQATKNIIGKLIVKEFSKADTSEEIASELLDLAYHFDIPQLEEMMSQFNFDNQINTLICKQ